MSRTAFRLRSNRLTIFRKVFDFAELVNLCSMLSLTMFRSYLDLIMFCLGGSGGNRTHDRWLKRPLLYRLSYRPTLRSLSRAMMGKIRKY